MSTMKLATIEKITKIIPILGADSIELARILGWDVVVKKGEYQIGDLCVYIPIDTIVNPVLECFEFLKDNKHPDKWVRINTKKIRGVYSQGLVIPLSCLPDNITDKVIGFDCGEALNIMKYEKENHIIAPTDNIKLEKFPSNIISKTDEDNLRTKKKVLKEFAEKQLYITKKLDGSSMTLIKNNDAFTICSRNCIAEPDSVMVKYVEEKNILQILETYGKNIAIQGEFCGPKINKNQLDLTNYEYYIFTIKDLDTQELYGLNDLITFCNTTNLQMVPLLDIIDVVPNDEKWNIKGFQDYANEITYKQQKRTVPGEGIVIRPVIPIWSDYLEKFLSVKVINQKYKD